MKMQFKEFFNIQNCRFEFKGKPEILQQAISGFSIDSRAIQPGEVFIAIKGDKFDGHQFISDVIAKGVQACVISKSWYKNQIKEKLSGN